jgi:hypothetical protein
MLRFLLKVWHQMIVNVKSRVWVRVAATPIDDGRRGESGRIAANSASKSGLIGVRHSVFQTER